MISNSLIVVADTGSSTQQSNVYKSYKVINTVGNEPNTFDFQSATSTAEIDVCSRVMEGLMRRSGKNIIPGVASKYEVSKDGLTYTFYLRDAVWSDGKPVTAYDFAYAWQRALDPKVASEYAFSLFYIKNAELYNEGKIAPSQLGIKVLDSKILQVELESLTPYFIEMTTNMTYMPARKDLIDKYGEKYFDGSMSIVVNGPFKLSDWGSGYAICYEKNPTYWNESNVKIDAINAFIYYSDDELINDYLSSNLDAVSFTNGNVTTVPQNDMMDFYTGSVWYIQFNNSDKAGILSNANIRKALSLSINRQEYLKLTGKELAVPALGLVSPEIIPGEVKTFREEAGNLIKDNDLQGAKEALTLGLKEKRLAKLPDLTFLVNSSDAAVKQGQTLAQMWKENLGINVKVVPMGIGDRLNNMYNGTYQITLSGWGPDYYDAMTYLEMFDSSVKPNSFGYQNNDFNILLKTIKTEIDPAKRLNLLKKAEKKIIDESVVAPLYFNREKAAINPHIKNVQVSAAGALFDFTFADVIDQSITFKTTDSKFSIQTNQNWKKQTVKDSELMIKDSVNFIIGAVSSETSTNSASELYSYAQSDADRLLAAAEGSTMSPIEKTQINGLPAVKYKIMYSPDYGEMTIYNISIAAPGKIYTLTFITDPYAFELRKEELDTMINSITIIK